MAKLKKNFYIGKGTKDDHPYLYYGEKPPVILNNRINGSASGCTFIGSFQDNPLADSIKDNEVIKVYIRKENANNSRKNTSNSL